MSRNLKIVFFCFITIFCWSCKTDKPKAYSQEKTIEDYYMEGDFGKVNALAKTLLNKDSDDPQANLFFGRALADMGQTIEAIPFLQKGTNIKNATTIQAWSYGYLGKCYYENGRFDEAQQALENCLALQADKGSMDFAKKRLNRFKKK